MAPISFPKPLVLDTASDSSSMTFLAAFFWTQTIAGTSLRLSSKIELFVENIMSPFATLGFPIFVRGIDYILE